jgi:hypothetical protein
MLDLRPSEQRNADDYDPGDEINNQGHHVHAPWKVFWRQY